MKPLGGTKRASGGAISRFRGTSHHGDQSRAQLRRDHPAVVDGTTLFQKSVFTAETSPRLLISGVNNAKTGGEVTIGPWKGAKVFTLSLVERETCPRTCATWLECYGNAMPLARRHRPTEGLTQKLWSELRDLSFTPTGDRKIAVRLHVLGDFFSDAYVRFWGQALLALPQLHVWGYTAHDQKSLIGRRVAQLNADFPGRCVIRFSHAQAPAMATGVQWGPIEPPGTTHEPRILCPASTEATAACSTCGLCWSPAARDKRIVFIGHGLNGGRRADTKPDGAPPQDTQEQVNA